MFKKKIEKKIEETKPDLPKILEPKQTPPPLFGVKKDSVTAQLFRTDRSAGNANVELTRIQVVWDMVMDEFKWDDCKFSSMIHDAQASVDGKYHNDVKEVAIAQEIENRAERKGSKPSIGLKILE